MIEEFASRSEIFKRGQVWYWEDPIYLAKEKGLKVDFGEVGTRYSRYVVIVQDPESVLNHHVLVVPCSSVGGQPHDVEIPIDFLFRNTFGFAKCQGLMPVHATCLVSYKCTLPDEALHAIDAEIIKMLNPYVRNAFTNEDIRQLFNIDLDANTVGKYRVRTHDVYRYVKVFVQRCIVITGNTFDTLTIPALYNAFESFCIRNHFIVDCDDVEFMDNFYHILRPKETNVDWRRKRHSLLDILNFTGLKLREEAIGVTPGEECTIPKITITRNGSAHQEDMDNTSVSAPPLPQNCESAPKKEDTKTAEPGSSTTTEYKETPEVQQEELPVTPSSTATNGVPANGQILTPDGWKFVGEMENGTPIYTIGGSDQVTQIVHPILKWTLDNGHYSGVRAMDTFHLGPVKRDFVRNVLIEGGVISPTYKSSTGYPVIIHSVNELTAEQQKILKALDGVISNKALVPQEKIDGMIAAVIIAGAKYDEFSSQQMSRETKLGKAVAQKITRQMKDFGLIEDTGKYMAPIRLNRDAAKGWINASDNAEWIAAFEASEAQHRVGAASQNQKESGRHEWTPEKMAKFLEYLKTDGRHATAKKYGISIGTVHNYKTRFKEALGMNKPVVNSPTSPKPLGTDVKQPVTAPQKSNTASHIERAVDPGIKQLPMLPPQVSNVHRGASRLANFISKYSQAHNCYNMCDMLDLSPADFYAKLSALTYFSILQAIEVYSPRGKKPIVPRDDVIMKELETWWFLSMLHNDMSLNGIEDYDEARRRYEASYGKSGVVTDRIIPILERKLMRNGVMDINHARAFTTMIQNKFCQ